MENRKASAAHGRDKDPVKVNPGDFEPPGASKTPTVEDDPPGHSYGTPKGDNPRRGGGKRPVKA
jgi:hypothetical protein